MRAGRAATWAATLGRALLVGLLTVAGLDVEAQTASTASRATEGARDGQRRGRREARRDRDEGVRRPGALLGRRRERASRATRPARGERRERATGEGARTRRELPRPFAALLAGGPLDAPLRDSLREHRLPLIMPRLRLPRVLAPDFPALRSLLARARPGEPVRVTLSAYCLRGTTRQGTSVRPGVIAADPRVFPMTRQVELFAAGRYLGRFRVEDTGRKIRGTRIDIWTPDCDDAMRFGMRSGVAALVAHAEE